AGDAIGLTAPACAPAHGAGRGPGVGDITGVVPRPSLSAASRGFATGAGFAASAAAERGCGSAALAGPRSPGRFRRTRSDPTPTLSPISAPSQIISPPPGEG